MDESWRVLRVPEAELTEYSRIPRLPPASEMTESSRVPSQQAEQNKRCLCTLLSPFKKALQNIAKLPVSTQVAIGVRCGTLWRHHNLRTFERNVPQKYVREGPSAVRCPIEILIQRVRLASGLQTFLQC